MMLKIGVVCLASLSLCLCSFGKSNSRLSESEVQEVRGGFTVVAGEQSLPGWCTAYFNQCNAEACPQVAGCPDAREKVNLIDFYYCDYSINPAAGPCTTGPLFVCANVIQCTPLADGSCIPGGASDVQEGSSTCTDGNGTY